MYSKVADFHRSNGGGANDHGHAIVSLASTSYSVYSVT